MIDQESSGPRPARVAQEHDPNASCPWCRRRGICRISILDPVQSEDPELTFEVSPRCKAWWIVTPDLPPVWVGPAH